MQFLIGVFAVSTIVATVMTFTYVRYGSQLRTVQAQLSQSEVNRALAQQIAGDVIEYSKTHPAVNPILKAIGTVPPKTSTPTK
ncbi:MAG: hypothetical protein JWM68_5432 [Verrucomicrobiales bacterium]|nr:hypothetical protein [Verrucomicrobiales bacterium]